MTLAPNPHTEITASGEFPTFEAMQQTHAHYWIDSSSVVWRLHSEKLLLISWIPAMLMQLAHPAIAHAGSHYSVLKTHTLQTKLQRMRRTADQMLRLTFGSAQDRWQALREIDAIHARVSGQYGEGEETRYSARDPKLLKWVYATTAFAAFRAWELLVGPLSVTEKDDYLQKNLGTMMGAPAGYFPADSATLHAYIESMLAGDELVINEETRQLARIGLTVKSDDAVAGRLFSWLMWLITVAILPDPLRVAYGFQVAQTDLILISAISWLSRRLYPLIPVRLRKWSGLHSGDNPSTIRR